MRAGHHAIGPSRVFVLHPRDAKRSAKIGGGRRGANPAPAQPENSALAAYRKPSNTAARHVARVSERPKRSAPSAEMVGAV